MIIETCAIPNLMVIKPKVYHDKRGFFLEAMNIEKLKENGIPASFSQENQAFSYKRVLRGLHFQRPPFAQGKLVRAIQGQLLDVAIDVRKGSPTYGQHFKMLLTDENQYQIWIPPGFAHGALTVSETSIMAYFCTNHYSKEHSISIKHDDPFLNIDWGIEDIILSDQDMNAEFLQDIETGFLFGT